MSYVNFDKYPSWLSWRVLNKNRGRMANKNLLYSLLAVTFTMKPCSFFSILLNFPHNYHMVKEEKGE